MKCGGMTVLLEQVEGGGAVTRCPLKLPRSEVLSMSSGAPGARLDTQITSSLTRNDDTDGDPMVLSP